MTTATITYLLTLFLPPNVVCELSLGILEPVHLSGYEYRKGHYEDLVAGSRLSEGLGGITDLANYGRMGGMDSYLALLAALNPEMEERVDAWVRGRDQRMGLLPFAWKLTTPRQFDPEVLLARRLVSLIYSIVAFENKKRFYHYYHLLKDKKIQSEVNEWVEKLIAALDELGIRHDLRVRSMDGFVRRRVAEYVMNTTLVAVPFIPVGLKFWQGYRTRQIAVELEERNEDTRRVNESLDGSLDYFDDVLDEILRQRAESESETSESK